MPARLKTLIALLALPALLLATPGVAAAAKAKTHTEVRPALHLVSFDVAGSKGWKVDINGSPDKLFKQRVEIQASGPSGEAVEYSFHGRASSDGTIDAKLPGVARIDVHFEPTEVKKLRSEHQAGCTGSNTPVSRKGVFRGTIELRGEGGYTTVHRTSASGEIFESPREVCKVKVEHQTPAETNEEVEKLVRITILEVGRKQDGGTLTFTATNFAPIGRTESGPAAIQFSTSFFRSLPHGATIWEHVQAPGKASQFTVKSPSGTPSEATVKPPAPYKGSSTFQLTSPTTANWSGDVRVDVPTLGNVMFTEPGFWSTLCENSSCTDTLPPGVEANPFLFGDTSGFTGNFFAG